VGACACISDCSPSLFFLILIFSVAFLMYYSLNYFLAHIYRRFSLTWLYNVKFPRWESEDYWRGGEKKKKTILVVSNLCVFFPARLSAAAASLSAYLMVLKLWAVCNTGLYPVCLLHIDVQASLMALSSTFQLFWSTQENSFVLGSAFTGEVQPLDVYDHRCFVQKSNRF
jgi:hypothetical protein